MSQRLNSYFTSSPELRVLTHRAQQLADLQRLYRKAVPSALGDASRVIGFERHILVLGADNSAIAAKLRQLAPHILHELQGGESQVTGILVKVQVAQPPAVGERAAHTVGETGREKLGDFAATIAESPLKRALLRLMRR